MDFRLTDEQALLIESLSDFLDAEMTEDYLKTCDEEGRAPTELMKKMADAGFTLLGVPEAYGGTPIDNVTLMLATEEFAKHGGPHYMWPQALHIMDMIEFGSEAQRETVMENVMNGRVGFALAISEPQAGSESNAITASATRRNGKVYINGHKTLLTHGAEASHIIVMTKDMQAEDPYKATSMWWVPSDAPGVTLKQLHKLGTRMSNLYECYLEDVEIDESDLIGIEGEGFMQSMVNFEMERLSLAAGVLGNAEAAYEDALAYANQRIQFGQKIGQFQLIQEKLATMQIKIENMKNLVYKCAWEKDNGLSVHISSAMAKIYCAQSAFEVCDDAMQILGGIGYTDDTRIPRLWRDCRLERIGGGTDEIMVRIIGKALLKQQAKSGK